MDDTWVNSTNIGSDGCDGSPIGGPTEIDSNCIVDMSLTQDMTTDITNEYLLTDLAVRDAVVKAGGFTWPQFVSLTTPNSDQCLSFFRDTCLNNTYLNQPLKFTFSEINRVFDPPPYFLQDLATFLLIRGPFAWLGYATHILIMASTISILSLTYYTTL